MPVNNKEGKAQLHKVRAGRQRSGSDEGLQDGSNLLQDAWRYAQFEFMMLYPVLPFDLSGSHPPIQPVAFNINIAKCPSSDDIARILTAQNR